jgi:hypothetical protein
MRKSQLSQRGQVVLVILLVISVVLVVGLSAVSRSVTDIKLSQQSQESARALLMAQAGLEKAIRANANINLTTDESLNVEYSVSKIDLGNSAEYIFPEKIDAGESVSFWFLPHQSDGSLDTEYSPPSRIKIGWGESESNIVLEANIIYKSATGFSSKRYVYGPDLLEGKATGFDSSAGVITIGGKVFRSSTNEIPLTDGVPYLMQLKLLLNTSPQPIGVLSTDSSKVFPEQGSCFVSTAQVSESGITRKLEQCQLWPTVPTIFNYLLFSEGSIGGGI